MDGAKPKKFNRPRLVFLDIIFIIIGCFMVFMVGFDLGEYLVKNNKYVAADAIVIAHKKGAFNLYAKVVKFRVERKTYVVTSSRYVKNPQAIDAVADIKYNPNDPEDVLFLSDKPNYVMGLIGLLILLIGVLDLVFGKRKKQVKKTPNELKQEIDDIRTKYDI